MPVAPSQPSRLLKSRSTETTRLLGSHRGPIVAALGLSAVLLVGVLLIQGVIARAAHLAVRGQVDATAETLRGAFGGLGRQPNSLELASFLQAHFSDGLRYLATIGPRGTLQDEAGHALGSGLLAGVPQRIENRVRVIFPAISLESRPNALRLGIALELEPLAANHIFMAGRFALGVVIVVDLMTLALGVFFSRALSAREMLRARVEAKDRLALLGEMSAVLAHELRNPLTSLKGHAQLLAELLPADSGPRKKADRVVREALRLEQLSNDLLEFVQTGALRLRRVDPREPIAAAIETVSGAQVDTSYSGPLSTQLLDPNRLRVALENVLRNAVQAGGTAAIELNAQSDAGSLIIEVRDHGPGIPLGQEEAIFLPFHTGKVHGTGLGLAIARHILELHGGILSASNHAEGGAVFRMTIPADHSD